MTPETERHEEERSPWGFRILVAVAALYLVLRGVQTVGWIVDRF